MGPRPFSLNKNILASLITIASCLLAAILICMPVKADAGINQQINFQGRLLNAQGAIVPDGYYNIEFKIYSGGDGQTAGDTGGTLQWTEDYLNANSQGVAVQNGFLSVQLGSIAPLTGIDWNSNTLWLSMNIAGTNTTCASFAACSPDGEMTPMKRLSANAYALNSEMLGGLSSGNFVQLGQGIQTDGSSNSSVAINKTGSGNFIQLQASGADAFTVNQSGDISFGSNANHNISVATAAAGNAGNSLTIAAGNAASGSGLAGGNLVLQGGAGDGTAASGSVIVKANSGNSASAFQVQDAGGTPQFTVDSKEGVVQIGSATANPTPTLLVVNNYSGATDPVTGYNGAMYYNTAMNLFRCYQNGAWVDCAKAGGGASAGSFVDFAPSVAQADSSSNSSIFINKTGSGNLLELQSNGTDSFVVGGSGDVTFGNNTNHSVGVLAASTGNSGNNLTVSAADAGSGSGALNGGNVTIQGGLGNGTGNGGNVLLTGGAASGSGASGLVVMSTPTFSTQTADPNCYPGGVLAAASCAFAQSTVDSYSSAVAGFSQVKQTATLPPPTNKTAGRVFYISAAPGSENFTLSVNGGGTGNEVSMRQNTSATMVWNGTAWGAAGASSSTDLQAAYDNTLQSAGGAELVVSHTSNTNGLTIRDSTVNPVNGPLLAIQTNSAATLFSINSNVTEYSSDSGAEQEGASDSTFPANTWANIGSATVSRYTTVGSNIATGAASVQVTTTATANDGVKNTLNTSLTAKQHYNVSFAARLTSGAFTDLYVYYSADGTSQSVACTTNREVISSVWTKVNCSFIAPASGITSANAILIGQTGATARTFYVDNLSVTIAADFNYATDGGVDDGTNFAANWPAIAGASVSRSTSIGNDASDSAQVVATGPGQGVSNSLSVAPLSDSLYRVTVYVTSTSDFSGFTAQYTPDNGTTKIPCVDYNTQTVTGSTTLTQFTKITCYIQTDGNTVSAPYVYFTQTDGTGRTFYVDTFSLTLATDTTPNVQIGGGQNGGPTTLFTLDSAASAPIASNNEQLLGSMYYDTSLGKIQCYEASGWGSCGSASNTIVTISPEYTNAIMHGTGIGTMTSDICSGTLNINDPDNPPVICSQNETYNFYRWTSPQATPQTYSIYVTYQLPATFDNFLAAQTSLMGRTDSSNATVQYTIYKDTSSGLVACGGVTPVSTGSVSAWQVAKAGGAADPATCGFTPDQSIIFKIDVIASQNADAYVGNLNFTFTNR